MAIIETDPMGLIDCQEIKLQENQSYLQRTTDLYHRIKAYIKEHEPNLVALEDAYYSSNIKGAITIGKTYGLLAAATIELPMISFYPSEARKAIRTGTQRSSMLGKEGIRDYIEEHYFEIPSDSLDVSDAICLAIAAMKVR